jgi:hypothetical protein
LDSQPHDDLFDHAVFFRELERPYRATAIVGQPYNTTLADAIEFADKVGLKVFAPPNLTASWWNPGSTRFFCFTRPSSEVRFLPDQEIEETPLKDLHHDGRMETIKPTEKTAPTPAIRVSPDVGKLAVEIKQWATDLQVIVGPVRWNDKDGKAEKKWYFTIETAWPGPDRYQSIMVEAGAEEREQIAECRTQLLFELTKHRPLVIHSMADEIGEVRLMETLWPCERATKLRKVVEEEHKSREQGLNG